MKTIRVYFKKLGRIKYISHLDINRCIQRAIKRSGLPVWYTEGFNPHIFISFALPLSLGFESECESFDIKLLDEVADEEVISKINSVLPEGLKVYEIAEPVMKPEKIAYADYDVSIYFENEDIDKITALFNEFINKESIIIKKKTKKGECDIDLKPLFFCKNISTKSGSISFKLTIASGNTLNINPTLFIDAFCLQYNFICTNYRIKRTAILTDAMENFR